MGSPNAETTQSTSVVNKTFTDSFNKTVSNVTNLDNVGNVNLGGLVPGGMGNGLAGKILPIVGVVGLLVLVKLVRQ